MVSAVTTSFVRIVRRVLTKIVISGVVHLITHGLIGGAFSRPRADTAAMPEHEPGHRYRLYAGHAAAQLKIFANA